MKRLITNTLVLLLLGMFANGATFNGAWIGLQGNELLAVVRQYATPTKYLTTFLGNDGLWQQLLTADNVGDAELDAYLNRFSAEVLQLPPSVGEGPKNVELFPIVPASWFERSAAMAQQSGYDMYNNFPTPLGSKGVKADYAPGIVSNSTFDNGTWSVGWGVFDGENRHLWQPPVGYEGDFARVMLYMLTVYSAAFPPLGVNVGLYTASPKWLGVSEAGIRLLLAWHNADAVSDLERHRNDVVESVQGNRNPFVDYPELIEYLWGAKRAESLPDLSEETVTPETSPLRAIYSVLDERINLSSPYVPIDAMWTVDGAAVTSSFLIPAELGIGVHELQFKSSTKVGKLLIEVK
jgi:hypothetical protein